MWLSIGLSLLSAPVNGYDILPEGTGCQDFLLSPSCMLQRLNSKWASDVGAPPPTAPPNRAEPVLSKAGPHHLPLDRSHMELQSWPEWGYIQAQGCFQKQWRFLWKAIKTGLVAPWEKLAKWKASYFARDSQRGKKSLLDQSKLIY